MSNATRVAIDLAKQVFHITAMNDADDAEASTRPSRRFVGVKSVEQQHIRQAQNELPAEGRALLHEIGFKGLRASGLKRKHAVAPVREWTRQGRSVGTMKNRTAHLRCWAKRIGRPGLPSNGELGIANRESSWLPAA